MNIPQNKFTQNKFVQNPTVKKVAKFAYQKTVAAIKRVVPGVCMMTCAFYVNHSLNKPSQPQQRSIDPRMDANWAYHAGQQRVRDSLKIVELENKILADSMKIYHLTKKAGLDKAVKK